MHQDFWKINGRPWKLHFFSSFWTKAAFDLKQSALNGHPICNWLYGVHTYRFRDILPFQDEKSQYCVMYNFVKNVTKGKYLLHASFLLLQMCSFRRLYYNIACGNDAKESTPCNRKMYWHNLLCSPFILSTG